MTNSIAEQTVYNKPSLVKYNTPIMIGTTTAQSLDKTKNLGSTSSTMNNLNATKKSKSTSTTTEDILNSILPPREWAVDGKLWIQYVSSTPATRLDVVNLQQELDHQLALRQARETGICPVRDEIYSQCFDELIRQVTINCSERGLLLLRCRDEYRMTITAYETLYESSIAFGIRKALITEKKKLDGTEKLNSLTARNRELKFEVDNLKNSIELYRQKAQQKAEQDEKQHLEEVRLTYLNHIFHFMFSNFRLREFIKLTNN